MTVRLGEHLRHNVKEGKLLFCVGIGLLKHLEGKHANRKIFTTLEKLFESHVAPEKATVRFTVFFFYLENGEAVVRMVQQVKREIASGHFFEFFPT